MRLEISNSKMMYTLDERPFGCSWEDWTTRWWKWFLTISKENHPAFDETGENYAIGQTDPDALFLAGTAGGYAKRTIATTASKALLFPVINHIISYAENPDLKTDHELILFTTSHTDDIVRKELNIDGINFEISENFRVISPPFDFSFPTNNVFGVKEGPTRGAGDGYWVFLRPLSVGQHKIRTFGSCMSGRIQIGLDLDLIVRANL
jgi:hypothetical protein